MWHVISGAIGTIWSPIPAVDLLRDGVPAAALVPLSVVEAVDAAEDELLAREAAARLEGDEPSYGMAEVLADIFEGQK